MAFGHCGIVAAASAVLADLEKRGILKVALSCMSIEHLAFETTLPHSFLGLPLSCSDFAALSVSSLTHAGRRGQPVRHRTKGSYQRGR